MERVPMVVSAACLAGLVFGCASQPVIVADPPSHERAPAEPVPWEEQYARAMIKPEAFSEAGDDPHEHQRFQGELAEPEERGALGVVADVLAFPFRAVGWLLQTMFTAE